MNEYCFALLLETMESLEKEPTPGLAGMGSFFIFCIGYRLSKKIRFSQNLAWSRVPICR